MKAMGDMLLIMMLMFVLIECTSTQKTEIEKQQAQIQIGQDEDISNRINTIITESQWPTEEQKNKLLELKASTKVKISDINNKIKKAKIVLVQNLMLQELEIAKYRLLKKEIRKLYNEKVNIMLDALETARKLLGKDNQSSKFDNVFHHYLLREQ